MSTCAGTNKDGSPCNNTPTEGSRYCHVHQDQAQGGPQTQPADPARRFAVLLFIIVGVMYLVAIAVSFGVDHWLFGG